MTRIVYEIPQEITLFGETWIWTHYHSVDTYVYKTETISVSIQIPNGDRGYFEFSWSMPWIDVHEWIMVEGFRMY